MADIKQLPGTEPVTTFVKAVQQMVEELPAQIKYYEIRALVQRKYYQELINQGFSKEDALNLTSKM